MKKRLFALICLMYVDLGNLYQRQKFTIMSIRITCITKAGGDHENPYVAISRLAWVNLLNSSEKIYSSRE
jgi:hypothetical protein